MLNCVVVNSCEKSSAILEEYINRVSYLTLTGRKAEDVFISQAENRIDLAFWDIKKINADTEKVLKCAASLPLLVCTTLPGCQYAGTVDLNIFGYLHQPISYESFLTIVNQARIYLDTMRMNLSVHGKNFIFVRSEYKIIKIKFDEILFCEGMRDYTQIYLKGKPTPILTLQNLKSFYSRLPPNDFIRVHRSFVVSLASIDTIVRNEIAIGKKLIPIGESFRDNFFDIVQCHS